MSDKDPRYESSLRILAECLETFRLPNYMTTFNEDYILRLSRLVWAMQILLKEVIDQMDMLGNTSELMQRIERLEQIVGSSKCIVTTDGACDMLGIGKSRLYKLAKEEGLPLYRPSHKMMLFRVEDIVDWVADHPLQRGTRPIEKTGMTRKHKHSTWP